MIRCTTKEEWDKATTEDLLNLLKVQTNYIHGILAGTNPFLFMAEPRFLLIKATLCKLGFPTEVFFSGEPPSGDTDRETDIVAHLCIKMITEYEGTKMLTEELDNFERQVITLKAPIGDLKKNDIVNLTNKFDGLFHQVVAEQFRELYGISDDPVKEALILRKTI